jgi:hypothetical protein
MRIPLLVVAAVFFCSVVTFAQNGPCTQDAVKAAVAKDAGLRADAKSSIPQTDDVYFFSGALDRPVIGVQSRQQAGGAVQARRKNESEITKTDRIVAAPSGDMAYEYGTVHISYDAVPSGEHADFTSAYLRVWRADSGVCKVAAQIAEPEDTHTPSPASK